MNPTRTRPVFPAQIGGLPDDWKRFLKDFFGDVYPQIQPFTPTVPGLTGGVVSSQLARQGRVWNVNITVDGSSATTSAYIDIPFMSFADAALVVNVDANSTQSAYILKNTNRLYLPNWTSSLRVIISGTVGE